MKSPFDDGVHIQACDSLELLVELAIACGLAVAPNDPVNDLGRILATPYGRAFVAYANNRAIGMAMAGYEGRRGWLYYVGVIPEARHRGVAPRLVNAVLDYLRTLGAPKALAFIRHGEDDLIKYYERLGFQPQPVTVIGIEL